MFFNLEKRMNGNEYCKYALFMLKNKPRSLSFNLCSKLTSNMNKGYLEYSFPFIRFSSLKTWNKLACSSPYTWIQLRAIISVVCTCWHPDFILFCSYWLAEPNGISILVVSKFNVRVNPMPSVFRNYIRIWLWSRIQLRDI